MSVYNKENVKAGDVILLGDNTRNPCFRDALMLVEEVYWWGVQGSAPAIRDVGRDNKAEYPYRAVWREILSLYRKVNLDVIEPNTKGQEQAPAGVTGQGQGGEEGKAPAGSGGGQG